MAERWRKPAQVLDIQQHDTEAIYLPNGRVQRQSVLTLAEETIERMRLGYMCMKCLEPFEIAWPERCAVCGVAVRRDQSAYFALEHDPLVVDLRATDWDDELAGLDERVRKAEEERSKT